MLYDYLIDTKITVERLPLELFPTTSLTCCIARGSAVASDILFTGCLFDSNCSLKKVFNFFYSFLIDTKKIEVINDIV